MNKEFQELKEEYQRAKKEKNTQKQADCLMKMSENLRKRNKGIVCSCHEVDFDRIYEIFLAIDGDMNRKGSVNLMTEIADSEREKQLSQNIYGPNNHYPK